MSMVEHILRTFILVCGPRPPFKSRQVIWSTTIWAYKLACIYITSVNKKVFVRWGNTLRATTRWGNTLRALRNRPATIFKTGTGVCKWLLDSALCFITHRLIILGIVRTTRATTNTTILGAKSIAANNPSCHSTPTHSRHQFIPGIFFGVIVFQPNRLPLHTSKIELCYKI